MYKVRLFQTVKATRSTEAVSSRPVPTARREATPRSATGAEGKAAATEDRPKETWGPTTPACCTRRPTLTAAAIPGATAAWEASWAADWAAGSEVTK